VLACATDRVGDVKGASERMCMYAHACAYAVYLLGVAEECTQSPAHGVSVGWVKDRT
jgi:hypothetical protein